MVIYVFIQMITEEEAKAFGPGMTAVSYVGWVGAWLHAHEIYVKNGNWPDNNFFNGNNR